MRWERVSRSDKVTKYYQEEKDLTHSPFPLTRRMWTDNIIDDELNTIWRVQAENSSHLTGFLTVT